MVWGGLWRERKGRLFLRWFGWFVEGDGKWWFREV